MAVERYIGTYVSAPHAENYINASSIQAGCSHLTEIAESLGAVIEKLSLANEQCNKDALSVDNATMQDKITLSSTNITEIQGQLEATASNILAALEKALDKKQTELNEIAMAEDQKRIKEAKTVI